MKTSNSANSNIRVAIVDDQPAYRIALRDILSRTDGLELVGACATGEAAMKALPKHRPEVVLLDLNISRSIDGAICTRELRRLIPGVEVIIHTEVTDRIRIVDALRSGAVGYILKSEPQSTLINAIYQAYAGGAPMSSSIMRSVVESFQNKEEPSDSSIELLTSRELEVLSATSKGARNKELASKFGVSPETIRNHLRHIYEKLRVNSRTEAAALYWAQHSDAHLSVVAA